MGSLRPLLLHIQQHTHSRSRARQMGVGRVNALKKKTEPQFRQPGTVIPLHMNKFHSETMFDIKSGLCIKSNKGSLSSQLTTATKLKVTTTLGRKAMTNLDSILKSQTHHFANKGPYSQSYRFSSSHVQK